MNLKGKIIIADANHACAEQVAKALEGEDYNVFSVSSGQQVLEILRTVGIHVLVSGEHLSDMECIDLLAEVKKEDASTEVIFLVENPSAIMLEAAIKGGLSDFLRLPLGDYGEVRQMAAKALEKCQSLQKSQRLIEDLLQKNQELQEAHETITALHQDTEALYYFGRCLSTSFDLDEIYSMMVNAVSKLLNNRPSFFFLFNEKGESAALKKSIGFPDSARKLVVPFELQGGSHMVKWLEEGVYTREFHARLEKEFDFSDFITRPIMIHNRFYGILGSCLKGGLKCTDRETNLLKQFITQSAFVIENALLQQQAHDLARHDELTGVYNRRYFQERIDHEIRRASREGSRFSLIILDIDYFKTYNDELGHIQGDHLLKQVVERIKERVRATDVISRFGGDEFVILFINTEKPIAIEIGDEIRKNVETYSNFVVEQSSVKKVTISLGVAQFPEDGANSVELIRKADQGLYAAKSRGRNQLVS
ncbi:MAG TPA: diguanylate cyclase [Nitrospiria bacterium]|nr:diguanylate cyclase [Nitrospiria bacterium]